jgi:hypothetical protein
MASSGVERCRSCDLQPDLVGGSVDPDLNPRKATHSLRTGCRQFGGPAAATLIASCVGIDLADAFSITFDAAAVRAILYILLGLRGGRHQPNFCRDTLS